MKIRFHFISLCFIIFFLSCSQVREEKLNYYKSKYAYASAEDWSRINLKNAIIENNVWSKEYARNNFQIIFSDSLGKEFGWYWEYAYTTKRITSTPVIIIGKKPWFDTTTSVLMPIQIIAIDSLFCSFEYASQATGNYENSIGLWITNQKKSDDKDIVFQLVCVFGDVGTEKLGTFKKTVQIGNYSMDEYYFDADYMPFDMVIFYMHSKDNNLQFDFTEYLQYLIDSKYIIETDYVSSVEMATSMKWGKGETVYKNYNCIISTK